jgi:hypothetical protein
MKTQNTTTGAGNTTAAQVNELLNTLLEIELLARDIKRSVCADAIVCKCIDVLAKYPKPTPVAPAQINAA